MYIRISVICGSERSVSKTGPLALSISGDRESPVAVPRKLDLLEKLPGRVLLPQKLYGSRTPCYVARTRSKWLCRGVVAKRLIEIVKLV
jgi:hypothetical protein